MSVSVKEGDQITKGDVVAKIMIGEEIKDIKAKRGGNVTEVKTFAGGMVNAKEVIVEANDPGPRKVT